MTCSLTITAQVDLMADGELLAHDVQHTAHMPAALQQLLRGRQVSESLPTLQQRWAAPGKRLARNLRRHEAAAVTSTIGPLLTSVRGQEEPYNLLCPRWTGADGVTSEQHCLSGCVATAIEQVMAYYQYPLALADTLFGWQTTNYVIDDLLPGTRFDWEHYLQDYRSGWTEEQGLAIALPSLAAGMAVHMNYGLGASGANVWRATEPLQRAMGYGMVRYFDRILYTPSRWNAMLRHELEQGRPIVYAGHNMDLGGHAFNIDGLDERGFYHVNWGYDGYYDGWYDLDLLDPWEPIDRPSDGYVVGFFCNQSALFMHPSADAAPLEPDTLALDSLGVELEQVTFLREPDNVGYVQADFQFMNHGADSVTYTYEVMTWLPTDTAVFYQADYVGLAGLTLAPGERRVMRNYLTFFEKGDRLFGISHDDVTIPFQMPVSVRQGVRAQLEWGSATAELVELDEQQQSCTYHFTIPVRNLAAGGYAADHVCYCLFADGMENEDTRHYAVLSLPGGEEQTLEVTFTHLLPATHYTLLVRCPWTVQGQVEFTTPPAVGVAAVRHDPLLQGPFYDLIGRTAANMTRGIQLQKGKKWLKR